MTDEEGLRKVEDRPICRCYCVLTLFALKVRSVTSIIPSVVNTKL